MAGKILKFVRGILPHKATTVRGYEAVCKLVITVGVIKNETLIFVNFSAQDASISKISVPIIKRRS